MPAPTITLAPTPPPNPFSQNRDTFNTQMQEYVNWSAVFPDEINDFGVYVDALSVTVEGYKDSAETAATNAAASAVSADASASLSAAASNIGGTWSGLGSGAVTAFEAMYLHNDNWYIPLTNLADASSVEPGTDGGVTWYNYTSSVSAGNIVSGPTDTTGANLTNVSWLVSRGIGTGYDASVRTFTNPSDLIDLGTITGICDGSTLGISGLTGTDYGTLTIKGMGDDASVANAVSLTFIREGVIYTKSSVDASTWGSWVATGGAITASAYTISTGSRLLGRSSASGGAPQELAPSDVRSIFDLAQSGAVGSSGLTMATSRLLGRSTAGTGAIEELTASNARALLGITFGSGSLTLASGYSAGSYNYVKINNMVMLQVKFTADNSISSLVSIFSHGFASDIRPTGTAGGFASAHGWNDAKIAIGMTSTLISFQPLEVPSGSRTYGGSLVYIV